MGNEAHSESGLPVRALYSATGLEQDDLDVPAFLRKRGEVM